MNFIHALSLQRRLTTLLNYSDEVFKSYSTTSTSNDHHILNRHISSPNMVRMSCVALLWCAGYFPHLLLPHCANGYTVVYSTPETCNEQQNKWLTIFSGCTINVAGGL